MVMKELKKRKNVYLNFILNYMHSMVKILEDFSNYNDRFIIYDNKKNI